MALIDTAPLAQHTRVDRGRWLALGLAVLSATSYALVLAVPYYAADQQWTYPAALDRVASVLVFWALGVAPFACAGVAGWAGHRLWTTRAVRGGRTTVWAALVVAVATLSWFVTQGAAILVWFLD